MITAVLRRRVPALAAALVLAALSLGTAPAGAQPRPLDVPFVPTPDHIVEAMLRLVKPTKDDFLVDLGSGDGRIPILAAQKYGVRGFGVDLNPERVKEARANAKKAGVTDKVEFVEGDLFKTDFRKATILTMYLLPDVNMRLRSEILEMKPGTRVVSHAFHMEDWKPDASEQSDFRQVFFWIVPAKIGGKWSGTLGGAKVEFDMQQKFQEVSGSGLLDGRPLKIAGGKITGEQIDLVLELPGGATSRPTMMVKGNVIEGEGLRLQRN